MIRAPGYVTDLGPVGQAGWEKYLTEFLKGTATTEGTISEAARSNNGVQPALLFDGDPSLEKGFVPVDWQGYPIRVKQTLNKSDSDLDPFIDWSLAGQTVGRPTCQEEYLEWRTIRRPDGKIQRLEFTTETPDYWAKLARYEPKKVIELAAKFAGETTDKVDIQELFGVSDPFIADPDSAAGDLLEKAYRAQNWAAGGRIRGAYNNGVKSIMHMSNGVNSTGAAVALAVFAAYPHGKKVGAIEEPLSGPEAIEGTVQAAVNCRNSDPTIVGVTVETVFSGSKVALMEAFGLYLVSFNDQGLTLPDGSSIPASWVSFQRGTFGQSNPTGLDLFQRLIIEAPPGNPLSVSDLSDPDGKPIKSGTQVARLINVGLYLRKTKPATAPQPRHIIPQPAVPPCNGKGSDTQVFKNLWKQFSAQPSSVALTLRRN